MDLQMGSAGSVLTAAAASVRPSERLNLSEWADRHFYLSPESSADPGPWTTLPYQRAWMDAFTDPRITQMAVKKSSRVGATKALLNAPIGFLVHKRPISILVIQPTEDDAKGYSKEEIEPMLRDCPEVGQRFLKNRNQSDAMLHKRFLGGILQIVGARSPANFRRISRGVILGDEVDGYALSAGNEGDPISLATKRADYFGKRKRKLVWVSTPTLAGISRIEQLFLEGDQRRYYVPCPHCQEKQVLQFNNLKWENRPPEEAVFICISCGAEIEHVHKRWMVERGEWRPGPHEQFPDIPPPDPKAGHISFHIWAAYSYAPNSTWGDIAREFVEKRKAGLEQFKTFVNTVLGETWAEKGDAPQWRRLYDRREPYERGTCPAGVRFLTCGIDVQRDGFYWEVVGWGRGRESWSIDSGFIEGPPADRSPLGPWTRIDELLDRGFTHEAGPEIRIARLAIDSGDQTMPVYDWVRTKKGRGVMAIKGTHSASVPVGTPSKMDVTIDGKKVGHVRLWPVGKEITVKELYGWLQLDLPTEGEREAGAPTPRGYCHFPQYDERFFQQITALQLITRRNRLGATIQEWQVLPNREDHYLSARRYARAAAWVFGLDRFSDEDWKKLEEALATLAREQVEIAAAPPAAVQDAPNHEPRTPTPEPNTPKPRAPRPRRVGRSKYLG